MGRVLAIVLSVLALLVSGLWVRSYWRDDRLWWSGVAVTQGWGYMAIYWDSAGGGRFGHNSLGFPGRPGWDDVCRWPPVQVRTMPFTSGPAGELLIADWFLLLLLLPYPLWRSGRWWRRRKQPSGAGGFPVLLPDSSPHADRPSSLAPRPR